MNNMIEEFTQEECDFITQCWDEPDTYKININPRTKGVSIINVKTGKQQCFLGFPNQLIAKFVNLIDIKPTYKEN